MIEPQAHVINHMGDKRTSCEADVAENSDQSQRILRGANPGEDLSYPNDHREDPQVTVFRPRCRKKCVEKSTTAQRRHVPS